MAHSFNIQYLGNNKIDKSKWDKCLERAGNGLIYGHSFYLDQMAKHWDALVLNDYEAVMPLTWNKKYGIYYLYQPFLCAQLGIFGEQVTLEMCEAFLKSVPPKFRYWDIYLNHKNLFTVKEFSAHSRNNFVLSLNRSYEDIYAAYSENIHRNIKKANQHGCVVQKDIPVEQVIELAVQQMKNHSGHQRHDFEGFKNIYHLLYAEQKSITYGVFSSSRELLSSCVFFFSNNRAYYILVGNHPNGRTTGASHALVDDFIKDHANQNMVLDFEGSDIEGLATFYAGFGASNEPYRAIRLNKLPWYLKWLKR